MNRRTTIQAAIRNTGAALAAVAVCVVLSSCDRAPEGSDAIPRPLVLRIGYPIEAPYASVDAAGHVSGQFPEIARQIARDLGCTNLEWRLVESGSLIDELDEGHIDVAAAVFVDDEVGKRARLSVPVLEVHAGLMVPAGNPMGIRGHFELPARTEIRVGLLQGGIDEARLAARGVPPGRVLSVPDARAGQAALVSSRVDVLVLSEPSLRAMLAGMPPGQAEIIEPASGSSPSRAASPDRVAFAFHKGNASLQAGWNQALARYLRTDAGRMLAGPSLPRTGPASPGEEAR